MLFRFGCTLKRKMKCLLEIMKDFQTKNERMLYNYEGNPIRYSNIAAWEHL